MKKTAVCFLLAILFSALSPLSFADEEDRYNQKRSLFIMPASLETVEDEAFKGTAVETIVFRDELISIGDYAFENASNLTDVYIPSTVKFIGKNAFTSNKSLTIHGIIGSLAERWANEHEIPFMPSNIWSVLDESKTSVDADNLSADRYHKLVEPPKINHLHGRTEDEGKSMRPQERPELNPIDYRFP